MLKGNITTFMLNNNQNIDNFGFILMYLLLLILILKENIKVLWKINEIFYIKYEFDWKKKLIFVW